VIIIVFVFHLGLVALDDLGQIVVLVLIFGSFILMYKNSA